MFKQDGDLPLQAGIAVKALLNPTASFTKQSYHGCCLVVSEGELETIGVERLREGGSLSAERRLNVSRCVTNLRNGEVISPNHLLQR